MSEGNITGSQKLVLITGQFMVAKNKLSKMRRGKEALMITYSFSSSMHQLDPGSLFSLPVFAMS